MRFLPVILFSIVSLLSRSVNAFEHLIVNELQPFGGEISNVDLEKGLTDDIFKEIHQALLQHKVLVFRNQQLSVEGQRAFSQRFGQLHVHADTITHYSGYNDVNLVSNIKNPETGRYTGLNGLEVDYFHSDLAWAAWPTKITFLYSVITPEGCGDTMYSNTVKAYAALPETLKAQLANKVGIYTYLKYRPIVNGSYDGLTESQVSVMNGTEHPIITTHPETGEKNIYASPAHTLKIKGMSDLDSWNLLKEVFAHIEKDEFVYKHRWNLLDAVLWDNRGAQHRATGCPDDKPRKLIRTTVKNDDIPREELIKSEL